MKYFTIQRNSYRLRLAQTCLGALALLLMTQCGTSSVYISVKRPAEINLKGYRKIAIGDIVNPRNKNDGHAVDLADEIRSALFESEQFDVLDRQHLSRILTEHSLAETGIIDESTAPEIGKIIGTAALIFGRLQTDEYTEEETKGEPYRDKKGELHQISTRKGSYRVTANLQVIDIQTAKILAARSLSATYRAQTSADRKTPANIDQEALFRRCLNNIAKQFRRMVASYDVQVRAAFVTDKLLPEVDQAVAFFRIGEWDDGMALLEKATAKPGLKTEVQAKTFYNLGLAKTYAGQYEEALGHLKTAMRLDPGSKRIQRAIMQTKLEQENAAKLQEQL